jgi:hypothetical protein
MAMISSAIGGYLAGRLRTLALHLSRSGSAKKCNCLATKRVEARPQPAEPRQSQKFWFHNPKQAFYE